MRKLALFLAAIAFQQKRARGVPACNGRSRLSARSGLGEELADMKRVAFITTNTGDDLIVSFAVVIGFFVFMGINYRYMNYTPEYETTIYHPELGEHLASTF